MHALQNKRINTKRYLRKGQRQQSAEEKRKEKEKRREESEEEEKERFRCASLAHVDARAFQPQYCFFAVTSVTRWGKIR